ncbi:MAG TPA: hypothetical protein VGB85_27250, partial [Nannocystis sp.]
RLEDELATDLPGDRGWTLRRLADRCDALQARAFARKLDALLQDLLHDAIGVAPPTLTPAWRDALRFYLGASDRNRALLRELLRFAAAHPGRSIAPTLPRNHAWLARAAAHMRTDAWLAPQQRTLEIAGLRHDLRIEDDPLEVLRMGIPFGTCLALDTGFNADSTVLNAVDINKRVLYLRDPRGSVIARQLIAVSSDFGLLGYRLYCARGLEDRPAVTAAFQALCSDVAAAAGLPFTDGGAPETIHPGFWYDDGAESWTRPGRSRPDLEPYFAALGRPVPDRLGEWALDRPRAWQVLQDDDHEAGLALLANLRNDAAALPVIRMVAARIPARELARRARRDRVLARVLVVSQLDHGPAAAMRAATGVRHDRDLWSELASLHEHSLPSAELARAWLDAAAIERRDCQFFDDHGLGHRTVDMGDSLACLPIAELLTRCHELTALWDWIVAEQDHCADCRERGLDGLRRAALASHARAPDPDPIVTALRGRHGPLAQDVALHVAARFSLASRPCPLEHGLGASWLTRLGQRPLPAPHALRAVRELRRARPDLADTPDMFAALVRQAGPRAQHDDLPRPTTAPFAALGELLLHLPDPAALLAAWHEPAERPVKWQPDPFEAHFHRTVPTPWRRHLARRVADDTEAALWLARLGDVDALTRLERRSYLALAQDIRRQHALRDRPADVPCDMSLLTSMLAARGDLRPGDRHMIDLALLREAARALAPPHDPATLEPALALLRLAGLSADVWQDIIARLLPPAGPPAPELVPLLADLLAHEDPRTLPTAQIARLAAAPALHRPLIDHLERGLRVHRVDIHHFYSQFERAPDLDPATRDAFLAAWISSCGADAADIWTPLGFAEDQRFAACLPIWLQHHPPTWLAIYRELRELHFQALFLDALQTLAPTRAADLAELHQLATSTWDPHGDEEILARQWLLAAMPAGISTELSRETNDLSLPD